MTCIANNCLTCTWCFKCQEANVSILKCSTKMTIIISILNAKYQCAMILIVSVSI